MILIAALAGCSSNHKRDDAPPVPPQARDAHPPPPTTEAAQPPSLTMPKVHLLAPQGDIAVEVELASTSAQIERGLMFREHLPPDHGMLFLMPEEKNWPFWMRNTLIPLDMIYITGDMTIAGIVENAEPRTETLREIHKPSRFVLEVNGGFSAAHKIAAGLKVQFDGVRR
ncbi:MAG TPA: DUF192 domain-containing protein [Kofleriaceae bacterium]|nr:DUF192 domain-containing protein [Kofleriaceae bacterium]